MHMMIKGFPCKVIDVSTSKTGKHGHAKAHIIAADIFTGKKMEDLCPCGHSVAVPFVVRNEYTVMDISEDGMFSLLNNETKDIKEELEKGNNVIVIVQAAIGKEKVISYR